jgi:hypothetical protein
MLRAMRRVAFVLTVLSGVAFAQVDADYALPAFAPDAGLLQETPALPVTLAPPLPEPTPPPKPPPPPSWSRVGGSATALFTAMRDYFFGGELSLLGTVAGTPQASDFVPGEVEGWVFQVGAQGSYGRAGGPACRGTIFCATRVSGGVTIKGGWARGLPAVVDNVTRFQSMYFAQLDVSLSHFNIESAPLSPGLRTFELLTRLRLGLHFTSEGNRVTSTGVTLFAAAIVEAIPFSSGTQGVSLGACVGFGL